MASPSRRPVTFVGLLPGHIDPFVAAFVDDQGLHSYVRFSKKDFNSYTAFSRADTPAALASWLLKGPGLAEYRQHYGV
jgi:hypothetical protein